MCLGLRVWYFVFGVEGLVGVELGESEGSVRVELGSSRV